MKLRNYELLLILLHSACLNGGEKKINPFPKKFLTKNGSKDVEFLKKTIEEMPSCDEIKNEGFSFLSYFKQKDLKSWKLKKKNHYQDLFNYLENLDTKLDFVASKEKKEIIHSLKTKNGIIFPKELIPNSIFKITNKKKIYNENKKNKKIIVGFHGSDLSNWFSILSTGLSDTFFKEPKNGRILGDGVYFSNGIVVAKNFTKNGETWKKNKFFGNKVSCIVVSEITDDGKNVKIKDGNYIVVQNPSLIKMKYLLCYHLHKSKSSQNIEKIFFAVFVLFIIVLILKKGK